MRRRIRKFNSYLVLLVSVIGIQFLLLPFTIFIQTTSIFILGGYLRTSIMLISIRLNWTSLPILLMLTIIIQQIITLNIPRIMVKVIQVLN